MRSQIKASENSIKCLIDETNATKALVKVQKNMLKKALQDESKIK